MEGKIITFEDIQKANETIKTTDIKGKDYAEVNQRIKAFRMIYPQGAIVTDLVSNENGVCIFKAEVTNEEGSVLGTGTAYEKEGSTFINKTSYIENCETSAVGRALGMAGFGIDTSVASAEEVQNAIQQQDDMKLVTKANVNILQNLIKTIPEAKNWIEDSQYADKHEDVFVADDTTVDEWFDFCIENIAGITWP